MKDNDIRIAVEKELDWEPRVNSQDISVTVSDGVVMLRGEVDSYAQTHEAVWAAGRVHGVKGVVDHLEVTVAGADERNDEDIAGAAATAILWNAEVPVGSVRISVERGRVSLEGMVDHQFQRQAADCSVRYLTGVRDISNHIAVKPHADHRLLRAGLEAALVRNAELDSHQIRVEASTDQVILRGNVPSLRQREEAESAAWASPGVCHVDNHILVGPSWAQGLQQLELLESRAI